MAAASVAISADLTASLRRCFVEARRRRCETVSLEQLLLVLLGNPRAAKVLKACAVDVDMLAVRLKATIQAGTPAAVGSTPVEPQASPEFQRALQRAIMLVQATRGSAAASTGLWRAAGLAVRHVLAFFMWFPGRGAVDGADMLVAVFSEKDSLAARELRRHGATRWDATRYIAHGIRKTDPAEPLVIQGQGLRDVDVVLFNDDFTPMEFVVKLLQDHFTLDREAAVQVMLKIHQQGRAVCGRFAADVAASKVELVRAAAHQEEHPLRCTVEPA